MASTSVSNPSCIIQVGEEYPYPSHNFAVNIVTVKLSGKDVYNVWEEQMLCLLTSHDMLGFIDGRFPSPFDGNGKAKEEVMKAWSRSDSLVKGWILGSLSERAASRVVNCLISKHENAYFSAKDAWDELKCMYGPSQQTEITEVLNPSCKIDVGEDEYPYPSHNFANTNIVTVKLSGKDVYNVWKKQMLCLLTSHDMLGFIDGRFLSPSDGNGEAKEEDMKAWIRSDSLVKGWILGSLSERAASRVVNRLISKHENAYFSAKDAWDELKCMYGPSQQTEITEVLNPSCKIDVGEDEYPCPSHNFANTNIVTVKLSGKDVYNVWKTQMRCLLKSHGMLGFIDGNGKAEDGDMAWSRSDSLVSGWILGSLSEKAAIRVVNRLTFKHTNADFSAKDAWDELRDIYGPSVPQQTKEGYSTPEDAISVDEGNIHEDLSEAQYSLYWCVQRGIIEEVNDKFRELELTPTDRIMTNGNTSLHVALSNKNQELLEKLLEMIPEEESYSLNVQNSYGSTPLHVAVIVGNTEAADILVRRNRELLFTKDKKGNTPLDISLYNMHRKISQCLLEHIKNYEVSDIMFSATKGDQLLVLAISLKEFYLSRRLVRLIETIHSEDVLMAIAQNFPCEVSFWEWIHRGTDYDAWEDKHRKLIRSCGPSVAVIWKYLILGISKIHMVSVTIIEKIVSPFLKERLQTRIDAIRLLLEVLARIQKKSDSSSVPQYYTNQLFEAARLNAYVVVNGIVEFFPDTSSSINEDGLNYVQYAVVNRSEKIYCLLYCHDMSDHKNIYKAMKDTYGNNLLHLAGKLAPADKLNLISGAALQIQRELQWFKEVEEFVGPIICVQTNYHDETPEMVFTREHKDLVNEGEKWMKATSKSYTITAALITTIVFAAAITVPGGNNQDTGIPIHNNNIAFKMFAVSDAISLFAAVTSLLMFLSILTTRFSVEDFLVKLPRRLILGLAALFISTSAMIIAFGATLFLVFGHDNSWILIPIGVLTCLPITSFVTLQFPLIWDLTTATYGRSIFDKRKSDEYLY